MSYPILKVVLWTGLLTSLPFAGLAQQANAPIEVKTNAGNSTQTSKTMKTKENQIQTISCRLTSPELQERKKTVIASLQKQVLEYKELPNGYAYRFQGTDKTLEELLSFIKTERLCCDFFDFSLQVQHDETVWLTLTGPSGAKEFIDAEIELIPAPSSKH